MSDAKRYKCRLSDDTLETCIEFGDTRIQTVGQAIFNEGPCVYLSKPDAIDLGKRLLEHFDVLPTRVEIEACDIIETLIQDAISRHNAAGRDVPEWFNENRAAIEATIAKLRRLVGEE